MTEYIDIPFESDPDALAQDAFDYMQTKIPNWTPAEPNLDVWLIRAISHIAAEVQDMAASVPTTIFRYMGANLFGFPPIDAQSAIGTSTWTMIDNAGYTIPDGTLVGVQVSGSVTIPFQTVGDVVVAPGSTSTAVGGVVVSAVNPGEDGSGLTGAMVLIDSLSFVSSIVLSDGTVGGIDAESDESYLGRLSLQLRTLAPRPIIPSDFTAMALDIPGVFRALALDGYDPSTNTFNNERMIGIAALDENGNAVDSATRLDLFNLLDSNREVNFIINMLNPTITAIDVTFQVKAEPGFTDTEDIISRVVLAIQSFLDPATWGSPSSGDSIEWINEPTVRYLSLADAINSVAGVRYIESLTLAIAGNTQASSDVSLPGAAPLTTFGTIVGTVDL